MNTMTETEAREKWCPMARRLDADPEYSASAGINRMMDSHHLLPRQCMCIASKCMAWRWEPASDHISDIVRHETGKGWVEWIKDYRAETGADLHNARRELERRFDGKVVPSNQGYCGAFGRPDE